MAKKLSKGSLLGFLRSRPFVSVADIRRRFMIETDEATPILSPEGNVYIGLPAASAEIVRQLWSEGKIGLHLSPSLHARCVEGLYAIRLDFVHRPSPAAKPTAVEAGAELADDGDEAGAES